MSPKADMPPDREPLSKSRLRLWLKLLKASGFVEDEIRRKPVSYTHLTLPTKA